LVQRLNASPSELLENFLFFEKQNKVPFGGLVTDWAGQVSRSFMNRGARDLSSFRPSALGDFDFGSNIFFLNTTVSSNNYYNK
jgi:hypothetical protein